MAIFSKILLKTNYADGGMDSRNQNFWEEKIESGPVPENDAAFDIIVVGGGPAGSAAASYAALDRNKVLLLEKSN